MEIKKVELGKKGLEAIEQSIRLMLFTPQGAIPMRPTFGNPLLNRIDEPIDLAQAAQDIAEALSADPRIRVRRVSIDEAEVAQGRVRVRIDWEYLGSEQDLTEVVDGV